MCVKFWPELTTTGASLFYRSPDWFVRENWAKFNFLLCFKISVSFSNNSVSPKFKMSHTEGWLRPSHCSSVWVTYVSHPQSSLSPDRQMKIAYFFFFLGYSSALTTDFIVSTSVQVDVNDKHVKHPFFPHTYLSTDFFGLLYLK